mgnify:CR=1 FL=1
MEEKKVTFEEKLTQLLELAKTKKNVLDNKEILNYFHGEILSPEQLDQIYDFLENHHVDVLRMDDDEDMEPELFEDGEEEEPIDVDNLDLSIPDGVSLDDPVRMYLKEIGKVPLLSPELNWRSGWSWEMKMPENVWRRRICAWLSALRSAMSAEVCSSLT